MVHHSFLISEASSKAGASGGHASCLPSCQYSSAEGAGYGWLLRGYRSICWGRSDLCIAPATVKSREPGRSLLPIVKKSWKTETTYWRFVLHLPPCQCMLIEAHKRWYQAAPSLSCCRDRGRRQEFMVFALLDAAILRLPYYDFPCLWSCCCCCGNGGLIIVAPAAVLVLAVRLLLPRLAFASCSKKFCHSSARLSLPLGLAEPPPSR